METLVSRTKRGSPLLFAALLAQAAVAKIPEDTVGRTLAPPTAAQSAPMLVRVEADPFAKSDPLVQTMNACVTQIVAREFAAAASSCDRAVNLARIERAATSSSMVYSSSRRAATQILAAAVSNRAVLKWFTADSSFASDLERARALAPDVEFVRNNLTAVGVGTTPAVSVVAR